jgi:hypothetical protein
MASTAVMEQVLQVEMVVVIVVMEQVLKVAIGVEARKVAKTKIY